MRVNELAEVRPFSKSGVAEAHKEGFSVSGGGLTLKAITPHLERKERFGERQSKRERLRGAFDPNARRKPAVAR